MKRKVRTFDVSRERAGERAGGRSAPAAARSSTLGSLIRLDGGGQKASQGRVLMHANVYLF